MWLGVLDIVNLLSTSIPTSSVLPCAAETGNGMAIWKVEVSWRPLFQCLLLITGTTCGLEEKYKGFLQQNFRVYSLAF
jgi:hypothetical protein